LAVQDLRSTVMAPFFHVAGFVIGLLSPLNAGQTIYPLLAFDPVKAMQVISRERCHSTGCAPTMILAMLQHPDFEQYDLSSLKVVGAGGAPVPVSLMEQVKARIGADVAIIFGQTEGGGCLTSTLPDDSFELKAATVGKPLPHIEVKIIDPATGQVVPVGERGELCYRGFVVMAGYYKMPEKTAETIDADGWLHSGDLATTNSQGYLNLVGRLKEMVIRGGENLFPAEIEEFLIRHTKVADVQVVGVPDAFFGEELLAVVIPKAGEQLTEQELRDYCKDQISHQKIPRYVQFVDSYPLTASGKVQKFVLREQAIKTLGLEEVANVRTA
jgi:fatty-acyl-CoA synthase